MESVGIEADPLSIFGGSIPPKIEPGQKKTLGNARVFGPPWSSGQEHPIVGELVTDGPGILQARTRPIIPEDILPFQPSSFDLPFP
tara:strand:- start:996 stop:1253 length:258 start_codon:yes stop_codon:yes gene_type:complete